MRDPVGLPSRRTGRLTLADPVPWMVGLFVVSFVLQRISVPGISIPVTVPIALLWVGAALVWSVVTIDSRRLLLWLAASGVSGALVLPQLMVLARPLVSFNSWALWTVIWLPIVVRFKANTLTNYLRALRVVAQVGLAIAVLSIAFMTLQLLGTPYHDWVADLVPSQLLVHDYVNTYPITYGSEIYKSNGWIALEPSFLSFALGVCLVAALVVRMSVATVVVLVAGLLSTVAGSGVALVGIYLVGLLVTGRLAGLRRYAIPTGLLALAFGFSMLGQSLFGRISEVAVPRSSTSLRAIEPYVQLWPYWISDPIGVLIGQGAGSSARTISGLSIDGLLVPSVAKVLFDYGLIGGSGLLAVMVVTYLRSPEPIFAFSIAVSMFVLQSASQPLVILALMMFAFWAPAPRRVWARRAPPLVLAGTRPRRLFDPA